MTIILVSRQDRGTITPLFVNYIATKEIKFADNRLFINQFLENKQYQFRISYDMMSSYMSDFAVKCLHILSLIIMVTV